MSSKSFFRGILSSLNLQGSAQTNELSSDEEDAGQSQGANIGGQGRTYSAADNTGVNMDEFIRSGARGIMLFKAYCVKSDQSKIFHLNLYNGTIYQYSDGRRKPKIWHCTDFVSINYRPNDLNFIIEIKKPRDVSPRQKRYIFETDEQGQMYKQYIEFYKEYGEIIRMAFDFIDKKGIRVITGSALKMALTALDIVVSDDMIESMLQLNDGDGHMCDYQSFFQLFINGEVSNVRDCLLEWIQQVIRNDHFKQKLADELSFYINHSFVKMPGEQEINITERVKWFIMSSKGLINNIASYRGTLHITNYRLVLHTTRSLFQRHQSYSRYTTPSFFDVISIPVTCIYRIYIAQPRNALHIICKDNRHVRIYLSSVDQLNPSKSLGLLQVIEGLAFKNIAAATAAAAGGGGETTAGRLTHRFFAKKFRMQYQHEGWISYDIRKEYLRQGLIDNQRWHMLDNSDWKYVDSYPSYLVVPKKMAEEDIHLAISHRSRGRFPVVTYRHATNGAVMTRSAQPLVGITMKTNEADKHLLNFYRLKGSSHLPNGSEVSTKFYIFDARRQIAATLNGLAGKGTEDASIYENTDLIFCDIDNIHVMRNSLGIYADSLLPGSITPMDSNTLIRTPSSMAMVATPGPNSPPPYSSSNRTHSSYPSHPEINPETGGIANMLSLVSGNISSLVDTIGTGVGFYTKLEESGWLRYIRLLLKSSVAVAEKMHLEGASVLVHCSDGWDRTAQMCALTQILLDPFFRTIEGLSVLIEKDWCSFGHKFHERCGHGEDHNFHPDERSPIFLQFLDSVHQLLVQFPTVFEYNTNLLCFIADHTYSCLFGNFLGNSEKERRVEYNVEESTRSVWSHVLEFREHYINPSYGHYDKPIWPNYNLARLVIWNRYYSRWDIEMHPNTIDNQDWHDDWGNGYETSNTNDTAARRMSATSRLPPRRTSQETAEGSVERRPTPESSQLQEVTVSAAVPVAISSISSNSTNVTTAATPESQSPGPVPVRSTSPPRSRSPTPPRAHTPPPRSLSPTRSRSPVPSPVPQSDSPRLGMESSQGI